VARAGLVEMVSTPINSSEGPVASGGYSQALRVTDGKQWLFISGQIPETKLGSVPKSFDDQADLVWQNVKAQLAAAGMTVDNLVKVTTFLSSRAFRDQNGNARRRALGTHCPALTVIIAQIYSDEWLLEIEGIAVK
jgi:2-iminobutanoate/2-iminopropanoate deaminase